MPPLLEHPQHCCYEACVPHVVVWFVIISFVYGGRLICSSLFPVQTGFGCIVGSGVLTSSDECVVAAGPLPASVGGCCRANASGQSGLCGHPAGVSVGMSVCTGLTFFVYWCFGR